MSPAPTSSREALLSSECPARCLLRASFIQSLSLFHPQPYPIQCKLPPGAHKLSCVSRRMAFPYPGKKGRAAGQCPPRPLAAGLTSSPKAPSGSQLLVWECPAAGCSWRASGEYCSSLASLWLPGRRRMGGTRPAKGCPGLDSTAVHLWARLGILALSKGQAARKVRHVGLMWPQGDPGLTVSGAFNDATNPFSGRAVVGNMAWLQCRHSRG